MSVGITLTILFLAELVLVAGGLAYYFYRQWQQHDDGDLEAEVAKIKQEAKEEAERSSFNAPLALQFLLDETRRYLQLDDNEQVKNSELSDEQVKMLKLRIDYLQAECKSLEGQGKETSTHWGQFYEYLTPLFPKGLAEGETNPGLWKDAQALCGVIKSQLTSYMDKVDGLIKRLSEGGEIDEETLAELQAANEFRDNLIGQLSSLSALAGANLDEDDTEGVETVSDMDKLKDMLGGQKDAMDNLMNSLGDDELKESLPELEAQLAEIERASKELKMCVDVLKMDEPEEPAKADVAKTTSAAVGAVAAVAGAGEALSESLDDAEPQNVAEEAVLIEEEHSTESNEDSLFAEDDDVLFAEIDVDATVLESKIDKLDSAPDGDDKGGTPETDNPIAADEGDGAEAPEESGENEELISDFDTDDQSVEDNPSPENSETETGDEETIDEEQYVNDAELDAILDSAIEDIDIK